MPRPRSCRRTAPHALARWLAPASLALLVAGCAPHGAYCDELGVVVCELGLPTCPAGRTPTCDADFRPICSPEALPDDGVRPRCE